MAPAPVHLVRAIPILMYLGFTFLDQPAYGGLRSHSLMIFSPQCLVSRWRPTVRLGSCCPVPQCIGVQVETYGCFRSADAQEGAVSWRLDWTREAYMGQQWGCTARLQHAYTEAVAGGRGKLTWGSRRPKPAPALSPGTAGGANIMGF